jgi:hypothetical protein
MPGAHNDHICSQDGLKHLEFFPAQPRTRYGRGTDGAVLFNEEKRPICLRLHYGHVSLVRADGRQGCEALRQGVLPHHLATIGLNLLLGAQLEQPL